MIKILQDGKIGGKLKIHLEYREILLNPTGKNENLMGIWRQIRGRG